MPSARPPSGYMVYDLTRPDPWGISLGDWGPFATHEDAERFRLLHPHPDALCVKPFGGRSDA